jgi:phage shock protein PspC (stress-responsive transcriptional regulator)
MEKETKKEEFLSSGIYQIEKDIQERKLLKFLLILVNLIGILLFFLIIFYDKFFIFKPFFLNLAEQLGISYYLVKYSFLLIVFGFALFFDIFSFFSFWKNIPQEQKDNPKAKKQVQTIFFLDDKWKEIQFWWILTALILGLISAISLFIILYFIFVSYIEVGFIGFLLFILLLMGIPIILFKFGYEKENKEI